MAFWGNYGVYHSVYDSFTWMSLYGDPTFNYHKLVAQFWGLMAMRLSSDRVLGMNYVDYGNALTQYLANVQSMGTNASLNINWTKLQNSIKTFVGNANNIEYIRQYYSNTPTIPAGEVDNLNKHLYLAERKFTNPQGLSSRKWFKHVIYAPGVDEGYNAVTFPGLQEAINAKNQTQAQTQSDLIGDIINSVAQYLGEVKLTHTSVI